MTDMPTLEQDLRAQIEQYRTLFDSIPVMLWYKDTHNRNIRINRAAAQLEGTDVSAVEGKSSYDLYPREQAEAFYQDDMEVINSGKPKLNILEQHTAVGTGEVMWLQVGKVPFRNAADEITGVIAFAVDVTERKRIEETLRTLHNDVEKQNKELSRIHEFFLSTLEQMKEAIQRGADQREMMHYLTDAEKTFSQMRS